MYRKIFCKSGAWSRSRCRYRWFGLVEDDWSATARALHERVSAAGRHQHDDEHRWKDVVDQRASRDVQLVDSEADGVTSASATGCPRHSSSSNSRRHSVTATVHPRHCSSNNNSRHRSVTVTSPCRLLRRFSPWRWPRYPHLMLSAAACCTTYTQLSIDIFCSHGAQQQTRRRPLLLSIDGTDGRTDARSSHKPCSATLRTASLMTTSCHSNGG